MAEDYKMKLSNAAMIRTKGREFEKGLIIHTNGNYHWKKDKRPICLRVEHCQPQTFRLHQYFRFVTLDLKFRAAAITVMHAAKHAVFHYC